MREIKFRAWNTIDKVMITDLNSPKVLHGKLVHDEEDILMQYTGLKDKNGTDVYEGDILTGYCNDKDVVKFEKGTFTPFHDVVDYDVIKYIEYVKFEVIGNIYETPELLNEKEKI